MNFRMMRFNWVSLVPQYTKLPMGFALSDLSVMGHRCDWDRDFIATWSLKSQQFSSEVHFTCPRYALNSVQISTTQLPNLDTVQGIPMGSVGTSAENYLLNLRGAQGQEEDRYVRPDHLTPYPLAFAAL